MTNVAETAQPLLERATADELKHYYYQMLLIRRFEERAGEMYVKAKIGGYCHLNLGEEATIVGLMAALTPDDYIFTNYREHGYIIARGVPPRPVMAELFGKETGVSGGRGGSMHLFDRKTNFYGWVCDRWWSNPTRRRCGLCVALSGQTRCGRRANG